RISRFAAGDDGQPIDPNFTGEIETRHPNGNVFEQLSVCRGAAHGVYRRYRADGTPERFVDGARVSTDFWPSGHSRHTTTRTGNRVIHAWFYPTGAIQKRLVAGKPLKAREAVRCWHENGQLAEEKPAGSERKVGPWRKFFSDGSRRLEAEYRKNGTLVI